MFGKKDSKNWKDYFITNILLPPKGVKKDLLEKISDFFEYHLTPTTGGPASPHYKKKYKRWY